MKIGTKSVLFGYHCFFIHPFLVAYAWWKIYGFPVDLRLWFCFFLHDIGYVGKEKMDDANGEKHVEVGANIIKKLFGNEWYLFCLCHSRFYAKKLNLPYSKLCVADKAVIYLAPQWLHMFLYKLTGEYKEYMQISQEGKYQTMNVFDMNIINWDNNVRRYIKAWVEEHKELKEDKWTPK